MRGDPNERGDASDEWRSDFPSVGTYVDALPAGWSSFPECVASVELLAAVRDRAAFHRLPPLPDPLRDTIVSSATDWIPEVHYIATMLAIRDAIFAGDREAFLQWAVEMSSARTASNAAFSGNTADMMRIAPRVWTAAHRGSSLHVVSLEPGAALSELRYPATLFPPVMIEYFARVYAVALVRTDAAQPEVATETRLEGAEAITTFTARWRA